MSFLDALSFVAAIFGIAMGIEWLLTDGSSKKISVRISEFASFSLSKKIRSLEPSLIIVAPAFLKKT